MDENLHTKVEILKVAKDEILRDAKNDLLFSKIYLALSPVAPLLVAARDGYIEPQKVLLNYLIIGLPLAGISLFFRHGVGPKLEEWYQLNDEVEFCAGLKEDSTEFDNLLAEMTNKEKQKILVKDYE